jgi:RimJ/RimL family protein N-acetyltransferase
MLELPIALSALKSPEVTLIPLSLDHAGDLARAASESREHYAWTPVPDGLEDTERYIATALAARASGQRFPFAVQWRGRLVGSTSYYDYQPWRWTAGSRMQREDRPDVAEIGHTWLAASAQRTRCNTEAKYLLLRHAFEEWQVHRVALRTDARNERSRNAMARLGAHFEGVRRADKPAHDDTVRDSAVYSIIASEWPSVRARLEAFLAQA